MYRKIQDLGSLIMEEKIFWAFIYILYNNQYLNLKLNDYIR